LELDEDVEHFKKYLNSKVDGAKSFKSTTQLNDYSQFDDKLRLVWGSQIAVKD
jgi:hypothetical protein